MNENPKEKKRGKRSLVKLLILLIALVVLAYIAVTLISSEPLQFFRIFGCSTDSETGKMADEYFFDVGRDRVFASLDDGSIVAAGTLGLQVLDAQGGETLRDPFRMTTPAISAAHGRAVAFDIGGTAVRVFGKTGVIASIETSGIIISASINRNGWFPICTQEGSLSRGVVAVYNSSGSLVYRVTMGTGYVLSAVLSQDNKSVAILNLTDFGSRITFYDLDSTDVVREFILPGKLVYDLRYLDNGDVLAISEDSLFVVEDSNDSKELYGFGSRRLGGYTIDGGLIAIHLLDFGVGHNGRITAIGEDGALLGEIETDREIISMSAGDGILAVLQNEGVFFFDTQMERLPSGGGQSLAAGATTVLALGGDAALAAGDHSAIVFRTES